MNFSGPVDLIRDIQAIRSSLRQFRSAQIYITFAELGLGAALDSGEMTLPDLASAIGADEYALSRFIDAAVAFELVEKRPEDRVKLTVLGWTLFSPSSDQSLQNAFKLEGAFYRRWGRLTEAVRQGGRPEANRAQEADPGWVRTFTLSLYENSRETTRAVAETIAPILPSPDNRQIHVLDLGGGHGGYSVALAQQLPQLVATVLDLPEVITTTREIVESSGVSDRLSALAGDFHHDPIGEKLDAVLLFGVLHGESPENASKLLRTIREALAPAACYASAVRVMRRTRLARENANSSICTCCCRLIRVRFNARPTPIRYWSSMGSDCSKRSRSGLPATGRSWCLSRDSQRKLLQNHRSDGASSFPG